MALRDNSKLNTGASETSLTANGFGDVFVGTTNSADAFYVREGTIGDDTINNFGKNDSLINYKAIFDGNKDGYITFGPNGQLDVDRTSSKNAGEDQITIRTEDALQLQELRYLGSKDGGFVYADSAVRKDLIAFESGLTVKEGTVGNDTFDAGSGKFAFLYDTALGLNLGGDKISNFGADDFLVTTTQLYNSNGSPTDTSSPITFGGNNVLDLSGDTGPNPSVPKTGPGGQIDFGGSPTQLYFDHSTTINGVTYYYYDTTAGVLAA